MERWLERLGYAAQWLSDSARAAADAGADLDERLDDALPEEAGPAAARAAAIALAGTLATRLLGRLIRPADVSWPRAVLAGVVGTLLYDAMMAADQRLFNRKFDTIGPLGEVITDDPDMQRWAGWAAHYAGGVGLALLYARYFHHRIPGPRLARGALFGLFDATTVAWGGVYPLLQSAGVSFPLPASAAVLAHAPEITAQSLLRHLAYGVGVGLVYRD